MAKLLALLLIVLAGPVFAQSRAPLFLDAPQRAVAGDRREVISRRVVHGNTIAIEAAEITLRLPGMPQMLMRRVSVGDGVWFGEADGRKEDTLSVAVVRGVMTAVAHVRGRQFELRALDGGDYVLEEIDQGRLPSHVNPIIPAAPGQTTMAPADVADGVTVDVMVVYTPAAAAAVGGAASIEGKIRLAMDSFSRALSDSAVPSGVRLVHVGQVAYTESGGMLGAIDKLRLPTDGVMDDVHAWRDAYGADVVQLITTDTAYCGVGYLMGNPGPWFADWAFSVVYYGCLGTLTPAHEIGHNMGSEHDRANAGGAGSYPYSYGYRYPAGSWYTVMSYACSGCSRIARFSNPRLLYNGVPTGIDHDLDPTHSADNARSLTNTMPIVAAFRLESGTPPPPPPPPPAAPTGLGAAAASSGTINLTWTNGTTNQTGVKIERSANGTTGWAQIALVGATATAFSNTGLAASTTYWYRVRATSAVGDSAYSAVASATTQAASPPPPPPLVPAAPSMLVAVQSGSLVSLSWRDNSANESGFRVERSVDSGPFTLLVTTRDNTTYASGGAVLLGHRYDYRVLAYNSAGISGPSNVATVSPVAGALTLAARLAGYTRTGNAMIALTWSGGTSSAMILERSDGVKRSVSNDGSDTDIAAIVGSGSYTYLLCEGAAPTTCSASVTMSF